MNSMGGYGGMRANTGSFQGGATGAPQGNKIPKGYSFGQIQQYTPEQLDLLSRSLSSVGPESYLSRLAGGDQSLFEEMEAPALRQFGSLQGAISSRFSGAGTGGRKSSGFQNYSSAAASNFAQDLQAQRQGLQRQAIMDLASISSDLLDKRPYDRFVKEKPKAWWQELLSEIGGGVASVGTKAGLKYFGL